MVPMEIYHGQERFATKGRGDDPSSRFPYSALHAIDVLRFVYPETVDLLFENYTVARSQTSKEVEVEKLHNLVHDLGSIASINPSSENTGR